MSGAPSKRVAYPWVAYRKAVMAATPALRRAGLGRLAVHLLAGIDRRGHGNKAVIEALYHTSRRLGLSEEANAYGAKIFRGRASRAARAASLDRPVQNLLRAMAALERMQLAAPRDASLRLNTLMSGEEGLTALLAASEPVIIEHPESILVIYVRALALAKADRLDEASALVHSATATVNARIAAGDGNAKQNRLDLGHLTKAWQVVDAITRDRMGWTAAGGKDEGSEKAGPSVGTGAHVPLEREALLQGRKQAKYLASCKADFEAAPHVREKLIAITHMLRQGLRRLPEYHSAYKAAREAYAQVRELWAPYLVAGGTVSARQLDKDGGLKSVRLLNQVLHLARELGFADDIALIEDSLLAYARDPRSRTTLWTIASVLVDGDPQRMTAPTVELVESAPAPQKTHEVRDFLAWAARARRHDLAHQIFADLPETIRRSYVAIHYVKILQRDGRFEEALDLHRSISATVLGNPGGFCPLRHYTLLKRAAELEFIVDSARWFASVPQPTDPRGVVMVAPRNAGQLTKYPMAVLMELKQQGWAVVPIVEWVLPAQPTGNPVIDQFLGCVLQDVRLDPEVETRFSSLKDFNPEIEKGKFSWGKMDLSQPLWEEGAINRRRYNVDFTCPSLGKFLSRLVEWTRVQGMVLQNAQETLGPLGLPVGTMVPFQARLPDAVVRFYCEERGDPESFFCLHASNGYENYFANFSRSFSTKCGMRNVTAHPELRTASFPIPAEFNAWFDARKDQGAEMLEHVRDTTKVRRSTRKTATPPPDALECLKRIHEWKAAGRKVACAFGKVVCDMAVPRDGGPAHANMKDWINHTIESVTGAKDVLLVIKPHPHELRNEIATFLTEYMVDLIEVDIPDNVIITEQDWFDLDEMKGWLDLGLIYNGTTAVELGLMNIPAVLCSDFAPTDYPIGHITPKNRDDYRRLVRFEKDAVVARDLPERAAAWLHYMSGDEVTIPYRYHSRPLTNKVETPPQWFTEDIERYVRAGDVHVVRLAGRITGEDAIHSARIAAATMNPLARIVGRSEEGHTQEPLPDNAIVRILKQRTGNDEDTSLGRSGISDNGCDTALGDRPISQ